MAAKMDIPMYLRIKRRNQTYFVVCKPEDTIKDLKEQVSLASKREYKADQMRIILPKGSVVLDDGDNIQKHEDQLKNESELYVVFQIADDEWEQVNIEDTQAALATD